MWSRPDLDQNKTSLNQTNPDQANNNLSQNGLVQIILNEIRPVWALPDWNTPTQTNPDQAKNNLEQNQLNAQNNQKENK